MKWRAAETYDFQLTDKELEVLEGAKIPADARKLLRREGAEVATSAFLKAAARLRAERTFYEELHALRSIQNELQQVEAARRELAAQAELLEGRQKQIENLEAELRRTKNQQVRELAAPAMAVNAEGTQH